jgi:hypothetical protein
MKEKVIFGLGDLKISDTQLIANDKTYSLQEVISVKHGLVEPKRWFPICCILIGSFLIDMDNALIIVGGFSILLGMIALLTQKTLYTVVIDTLSGEHQAFSSENSNDVDNIIRAINTAIINKSS